ncbi:MAG TPA: exopolysaccharide transport family protein [Bradyrhizobium sp.]|uniref:GumC family protein n=1 Tax=Bradyrhizobium sp. TaxID=376 RepID=UPI002D7FF937|nr:exopolysaccharide transport family protein [Bradyrhizobium sp.]HET7888001.1 exopolysaccharide transport family protein [Bradyrhizobium sp.]
MLAYDQPIARSKPDAGSRPARNPAGLSVTQLVQLLWRHKTAIAAAGLIGACAAIAIGKSLTPKYFATAQLYVDPRELQLVDRELTPRSQDISGLAMVVESQARVITSNSVLMQVIQDTHIDKDPEFGGNANSAMSSLLGLFGLDARQGKAQVSGQTAALDALNRHINVKKTDRTFIVDIDVWSEDPAKAAMLANAISNAYLVEAKNSQAIAARRATSDLSGRLKELQERLRTAENALAIYKAQNNFVGTQDTLITDQQLLASNQRLAAAHAATLDAQAKYDQIEASRRAAGDAGAIPEALQSPTLANLRAQYAEARRRLAEMTSELGPLHPSLRQMSKQVEDLHRTINEEIDRYAQSAKNDLTRARDYETSLTRSLEAQKRQSVQLSQASVRLRELERDVEASRDVYQSFLKRSRETEEQESLNTSNARIIGEATVPQRRAFPPAMSLIAAIGLVFGMLAAAMWFTAIELLSIDPAAGAARPAATESATPLSPLKVPENKRPAPTAEKPGIARLQESDVIRTLGGILASGGVPDLTRLGWPTLRSASPRADFTDAMRSMREALVRRSAANVAPVMAVIGQGASRDRSIVALNVALAAARDDTRVLIIDADHDNHLLSNRLIGVRKAEAKRLGWLSIGSKAQRAIKTRNNIEVLPAAGSGAGDALRKAIAQARAGGDYDLVIVDGPALPFSADDLRLIGVADGLVAALPASLDINGCMDDIITGLGGAERKLVGVIINELHAAPAQSVQSAQHA